MSPSPPPPPALRAERPSRLEVILSAAACPGAGQFLQRRWWPAVLFMVGSLAAAGLFIREVLGPYMTNLAILLGMGGHRPDEPLQQPSIARMAVYFGVFMAVYLVSVADAASAYGRRLRAWQRQVRAWADP